MRNEKGRIRRNDQLTGSQPIKIFEIVFQVPPF